MDALARSLLDVEFELGILPFYDCAGLNWKYFYVCEGGDEGRGGWLVF